MNHYILSNNHSGMLKKEAIEKAGTNLTKAEIRRLFSFNEKDAYVVGSDEDALSLARSLNLEDEVYVVNDNDIKEELQKSIKVQSKRDIRVAFDFALFIGCVLILLKMVMKNVTAYLIPSMVITVIIIIGVATVAGLYCYFNRSNYHKKRLSEINGM